MAEEMEALKKELDDVKKRLATVIAKDKVVEPNVVFTIMLDNLTEFCQTHSALGLWMVSDGGRQHVNISRRLTNHGRSYVGWVLLCVPQ